MKFNDGMKFNLKGELRIQKRSDGLYVVGRGMLIPVNSYSEALELINDLQSSRR